MKKTEEKEEKKKGRGIRIQYKEDGIPYASMIVGDIPIKRLEEWEKDCKQNYSGCRWAKMMSDHQKAQTVDLLIQDKFEVQQNPVDEKEKPETTLSGEEII